MTKPKDPNSRLFFAINFSDGPGEKTYLLEIESACADGADINGFSEQGETPLTRAILSGMGSPKAVQKLLQLGADPSKRDKNGWTPWGACLSRIRDSVVADRMQKIKKLLIEYHADQSDENLLKLEQAVIDKKTAEAESLLKEGIDPNSPFIHPMFWAIRNNDIHMIRLLLTYRADPNGGKPETYLMQAAGQGNLDIVKLLVEAGADISKFAYNDKQFTAEFFALENDHQETAEWLHSMTTLKSKQQASVDKQNPKFIAVYEKQTNGANYDILTDDIIKKLEQWDSQYGIDISDVEHDRMIVHFSTMPDDIRELAKDIYQFCPDVIDQHFGCMDQALEIMTEHGQQLSPEIAHLIDGIDFKDENFGETLLIKSLKSSKSVSLWWD